MSRLSRRMATTGLLALGVLAAAPMAPAQQKYALLISAGRTDHDDDDYHSEYWYDLFLMYRMLVEHGFGHDDIFVLYGDGNDFASAYPDYQRATFWPALAQIADYSNHKSDINNIFTWLASGNAGEGIPQIQAGDFLFYWWMGHGSGTSNCDDYVADIENTGEHVTDDEFAALFAQLPPCAIRTPFIMTCHSGGLVNELEGLHSMVHAAERCDTGHWSQSYDVFHAVFSYHLACALREQTPAGTAVASDTDGDGAVSADEANAYVHLSAYRSVVGDYRGIAPLIDTAAAQPASGVPTDGVYSRDYEQDYGAEPSDTSYVWYHGPDLWVRHAQDGDTAHQEPEYGQTNYVYARLHNLDCSAVSNIDVELSWCDVSAWSNPAGWNPIGTTTVSSLDSSASEVVSLAWSSVPAPGDYCLHTVLDAPGDPPNSDGRAYMDNNKVQINVTVEDNWSGWAKVYHWFIENGSDERAKVDVILEKLRVPEATVLRLGLPSDLRFEEIAGAERVRSPEGRTLDIPAESPGAAILGVALEPNEKQEAVLSVVTPEGMRLGEEIVVRISERMDGEEKGGIVFRTRTASQSVVLSTLLRRMTNVFGDLGKRLRIREFTRIAALSERAQRGLTGLGPQDPKLPTREIAKLAANSIASVSRVMPEDDMARFEAAAKASVAAAEDGDLGRFVEAQEELIHSTRPLFVRR